MPPPVIVIAPPPAFPDLALWYETDDENHAFGWLPTPSRFTAPPNDAAPGCAASKCLAHASWKFPSLLCDMIASLSIALPILSCPNSALRLASS